MHLTKIFFRTELTKINSVRVQLQASYTQEERPWKWSGQLLERLSQFHVQQHFLGPKTIKSLLSIG